MPIPRLFPLALATLLVGCAASGPARTTLATGSDIEFEGRIESIDTAPWAYDGNARLVVDSSMHGPLAVELPARWNLCKASGIGEAGSLTANQRVRVAGRVTAPGIVTVCEGESHRIEPLQ